MRPLGGAVITTLPSREDRPHEIQVRRHDLSSIQGFRMRWSGRRRAPVSDKNVELHRRGIEAFNARDIEAFIALSDPQIELRSSMTTPGGAVYPRTRWGAEVPWRTTGSVGR